MMQHLQVTNLRNVLIASLSVLSLANISPAQSTPQLNRKFAKKVTVDVKDEPFGKFLNDLAKEHKVSIELDSYKIAADGFSIDDTISLSLKNVSLFSVVKLASESLQLTVLPEGAGVFVTTHSVTAEALYEKQYNLPWIQALRVDSRSVAAVIETTTPGPWMTIDAEGGEFTAIGPAAYRISQSWRNHQIIENLLFQIESIVRGKGVIHGSPAELATIKKIQKSVEQAGEELPLREYLNNLLIENGINCWLDQIELSNEGIDQDLLIHSSSGKKSIFEHLVETLKPHELVPFVEGEVVKITTTLAAEEAMVTRVYDVRKQARQVGTTEAIVEILMKTPGTAPWSEIEQVGGEWGGIGPLLVIEHNRHAHQIIQKTLQ